MSTDHVDHDILSLPIQCMPSIHGAQEKVRAMQAVHSVSTACKNNTTSNDALTERKNIR